MPLDDHHWLVVKPIMELTKRKVDNHYLLILQELPFDMSVCSFVLVQALSVRALQEMVSAQSDQTVR